MSTIIQVNGLTKNYGSNRGITDVSFEINEGEVFGFLGPNGAGKTTAIRVLMGLLRPTAGQAIIGGLNCWTQATEVKRLVGYLPSEFSFDASLKGAQIIEYLGNLRGGVDQKHVRSLIERLGLDPSKRFRDYSRGNKQKIGLVQAFMHRPRLLILDEPTGGLDPLNQQEFYTMISEVHAEGRTVFLSSHILPEIEHMCERVGIIREGNLIQVSEVAALKDIKQHEVEMSFATSASTEWFTRVPGVLSATSRRNGLGIHLTVQGDLREVIKLAAQHDAINLVIHEPSLEEIFLRFYEPEQAATAVAK
ncbi:MAG: ABC transporter ATP-binding protein [Ktedonobacteraceae bacterium]